MPTQARGSLTGPVRRFPAVHRELGIVTDAWSPLAQGAVVADPMITAIAEWLCRKGSAADRDPEVGHPVPDRGEHRRVRAPLAADLAALDALDSDGRIGPHPARFDGQPSFGT